MCGIAGVLRIDGGAASREVVSAMAAAQYHRGPDDGGVWCDGAVGLGNRRLSIIGLDHTGHQPLCNEDGSVWVTFNGEIYNFRDIRDRLRRSGHVFRSATDTEVLVHAYEEWGPERFLDDMNGIFGFALWDRRLQRLVIGRDRLGIKRVYVEVSANQIAFASEIGALSDARSGAPRLDHQSLDAYLALGYIPEPGTIWQGVTCLAPGTIGIWEEGRLRTHRYWTLRPGMHPSPKTFDEAVGAVRDGVTEAVRRQLVSDVPLGVFLSGGLDSGGVAAIMAAELDGPVQAFTVGYDTPGFDEAPAARAVARHIGAQHEVRIVGAEVVDRLPGLARQYGQPFADSSAVGVSLVSELAARHVKVVLCGDGGDELFGGYPTYSASQLVGTYRVLPRAVQRTLRQAVSRLPVGHGKVTTSDKLRRFVAAAHLSPTAAHVRWREYFSAEERARLLGRPSVDDQLDEVLGPFVSDSAEFGGLDRYLALDVGYYLPSDMLCKVDVATMMHSIEARVPLLDHELVELAFSLPAEMKRRAWSGKRVLRAALADLLPRKIVNAKKRGFNVPIAAWLAGPLYENARELLRPGGARAMELMDASLVARLLDEHRRREHDHAYKIWTLLAFAYWYEALDARGGTSTVDHVLQVTGPGRSP